jgi:hypothetical protein
MIRSSTHRQVEGEVALPGPEVTVDRDRVALAVASYREHGVRRAAIEQPTQDHRETAGVVASRAFHQGAQLGDAIAAQVALAQDLDGDTGIV